MRTGRASLVVLALLLPTLVGAQSAGASPSGPISGFGADAQGRIVIALRTPRSQRPLIARFTPAGALDRSFSGDGILRPPVEGVDARIAVAADGSVFVGGRASEREVVLRRYGPGGAIDRRFGGTHGIGLRYEGLERLALQPDGSLLAFLTEACPARSCGTVYRNLGVERYSPLGRHLHHSVLAEEDWKLRAVGIAPDGSFVVHGEVLDLGYQTYDRFGSQGEYLGEAAEIKVTVPEFGEREPAVDDLLAGTDGGLILSAAGTAEILRRLPDGSADPSFGGGLGQVSCGTDRPPGVPYSKSFLALAAAPGGAILAAGGTGDCGLVRYLADGSPDPGFGRAGGVDLEAQGLPRPAALVPLPGGSAALAGWLPATKTASIFLSTATGALDGSFGAAGVATLKVGRPG